MAKNNQMGTENTSKGDCKEEKKPGKMKEILGKITRPLVEGIAVAASVAVLSAPGCALDLDGKGKFRTDADAQEEQVEDAEVDVPEEIEDIIDVEGEDVSIEDTIEDPIEEDPIEEDSLEEDPERDVSEEDGPIDVVDADEVELPECDPIVTAPITTFIGTGTSTTVGNITIEYTGLTGTDGSYVISCDASYVGTLYIPEGGRDSLDLGGGYSIEVVANTARSHGSNVTIEITGP